MTTTLVQTAPATTADEPLDVERVRADFPILRMRIHGKPLVYLDNANTTQKPAVVLEALQRFYRESNANIHRATHTLSERATEAYEGARERVRRFLNASNAAEIVFVRNATEGINLVAQTFGRMVVKEGDEILLTEMEHHANIVPWQMLCEEKGARIRVAPINDRGELILDELERLLTSRTRLVGVVQMSNALGTVNPVGEVIGLAHARGIPVLVDGAQSAYHMSVDVRALDCDFFVFSGHKLYGPTGIGALYGRQSLLDQMPPYQGGGDMIRAVTFEKTIYADPPHRFEAGTPHIAGAAGLTAAVEYLHGLGMERVGAHEAAVLSEAEELLAGVPGLRLIGTPRRRASVISFVLEGVHPHDIGTWLDAEGIAVRTGQHCAHPVMRRFGVPATVRMSLACYNTREEVRALAQALGKVREVFA